MKISEAAELTGLTPQNIRFYEKQNLLSPDRIVVNQYRKYEGSDIRRLKEIKMLRRLGISVSDIALMQKGLISPRLAFSRREQELAQELEELSHMKEICGELCRYEQPLAQIDPDTYLDKIDRLESGGAKFCDIVKDFMLKVKDSLPSYRAFVFEPNEPIMNKRDFTTELVAYCEREHKDLTVIKEGMMPLIEIDGEKYMCQLEQPRSLDLPFPFSSFFMFVRTYGFRFVYGYHYDYQE